MSLDTGRSPYGPLHAAAAAGAVLLVACTPALKYGPAALWKMFLYGTQIKWTLIDMAAVFIATAVVFGGVSLVVWATTLFGRKRRAAGEDAAPAPYRAAGVKSALAWTGPLLAVALLLSAASKAAVEALAGVQLADQALVEFMCGEAPLLAKCVAVLFIVFEAPLLEEPLFRGIVFRGFARAMPFWPAALLGGIVFALVHMNAATLVPLWFVGVAFSWLYRRTGTILAPMTAHALFNATNLALLPFISP